MSAPGRWIPREFGTLRGGVRHALGIFELWLGRLRKFQGGDVVQARRLVFVCLGNINRSAFGAAVARAAGEPAISIGLSTTTGAPATPEAQREAALRRIDLSTHAATDIQDYGYREGDVLLVMEVRHAHRLVAMGLPPMAVCFLGLWARPRRVHLHDPHTLSGDYFHTCFGLIEDAVNRIAAARREGRS
jgi:protein-tyrosine phosphatase